MKKSTFSFALIAVAAIFVSCQQENADKKFKNEKDDNVISFVLGSKDTKAEAELEPVKAVKTVMPIGLIDETTELVLEESIVSLDDFRYEPETKGTPVYTENVKSMGSFNAIAYKSDFSGVALADARFGYDSDRDAWRHSYDSDPWASGDTLWFFMRMGDMAGVEDLNYALTDTPAGQISFSYTSPATAADQKDILFASRPITKTQEDEGKSNVLFYHALTAVKFRTGVTAAGTEITKVTVKGLASEGDCEMVPYYGEWSGSPKSNPYGSSATSSKSYECVEWNNLSGSATSSFSQSFSGVVDFEKATGKGAVNPFADSFYAAAADSNLNDKNASLTFWFIPQQLNKDVELIIDYKVQGIAHTVTLKFGDLAKGSNSKYPEWKAGELRTYTLSAIDVNVTVTDEVTDANVKQNVEVTNTGNVPVYIRAAIVGTWVDVKGQIINCPWDPENHGTFTGNTNNNWTKGADGFYYYKYQVPVGADTIGKLFNSYTPKTYAQMGTGANPELKNAHLEMYVIVQAIQASKLLNADGTALKTGSPYGWNTSYFNTATDKE